MPIRASIALLAALVAPLAVSRPAHARDEKTVFQSPLLAAVALPFLNGGEGPAKQWTGR